MFSPQLLSEFRQFVFGSGYENKVASPSSERSRKNLAQSRRRAGDERIMRVAILICGVGQIKPRRKVILMEQQRNSAESFDPGQSVRCDD